MLTFDTRWHVDNIFTQHSPSSWNKQDHVSHLCQQVTRKNRTIFSEDAKKFRFLSIENSTLWRTFKIIICILPKESCRRLEPEIWAYISCHYAKGTRLFLPECNITYRRHWPHPSQDSPLACRTFPHTCWVLHFRSVRLKLRHFRLIIRDIFWKF